MKEYLYKLFIIYLCINLTGCATVINGTRQKVNIDSSPQGANVSVDGEDLGVTPLTVKLRRKVNHVVKIELSGYQSFEKTIRRELSGWVWGSYFLGGIILITVDILTGAMHKLTPDKIEAKLDKSVQD